MEVEAIRLRMLLLSKQIPSMTSLFLTNQMDHKTTGKTTYGDVRLGCGVLMGGHLFKPTECVAVVKIVG